MSNDEYPSKPPTLAEQEREALEEYQRRIDASSYACGPYLGYVTRIRNVSKAKMVIKGRDGQLMEVEYQKLIYSPYMSVAGRMKEMWVEHRAEKQKLSITTEVVPVWLPPTYPELEQLCREAVHSLTLCEGETEQVNQAVMVLITGLRRASMHYVDVIATLTSDAFGTVTGRVRAATDMKERGSAEQTRPIETAETSAVGRAAALAGYGLFPGAGLANAEDMRDVSEREDRAVTDNAPNAGAAPTTQALDEAGNLLEAGQMVPSATLLSIKIADGTETEKRWLMRYFDRELHLPVQKVLELVPIGEHPDETFGELISMVERAMSDATEQAREKVASEEPATAEASPESGSVTEATGASADTGSDLNSSEGEPPTVEVTVTATDGREASANPDQRAGGQATSGNGLNNSAAQFFAAVARSGVRVEEALTILGVARLNEFPGGAEGALPAFQLDRAARAAGWESGQELASQVFQKRLAELSSEELQELDARLEASAPAAAA